MQLKDLGEDEIVRRLAEKFTKKHPRLKKAIGDDTSVTVQKGGNALLATTDVLIEDTHFKEEYTSPYLIGKKALAISLSDIAAMGGTPLFFLVSIALRPETQKNFIDGIYKGLSDLSEKYGCLLAGGNTAKINGKMFISTTVFGEMDERDVVYRSGAKAGDVIYVTGTLGDSALGLRILKNYGKKAVLKGPFRNAVLRHLDPEPRLEAGQLLAERKIATSMMDISDGLALDLKRLCAESGVAAVIETEKLPLSEEIKEYGKLIRRHDVLDLALSGGEDYELLFTAPHGDKRKITSLSKKLELPMTAIGRIVEKGKAADTLAILDASGKPVSLKRLGFEHF